MKRTLCLFLFPFVLAASTKAETQRDISFARDVRPILSDHCFACHGPDENKREADLRLDTKEGAFADLGDYQAFVPRDLEKSEAIYRILTDDGDDLMPPAKHNKPLTKEQIEILKAWVSQGADWEMHWAYTPVEKSKVEAKATGKSEIDRLVRSEQEERGLTPSGSADKVTLVRRLHLDLTGLPPSPEEVDAFVNDASVNAYEVLVDRLLKSKHFGERMAIYWLDLVRYADTIGYHSDTTMEVSAYRDYVIEAFNENKPYDQFTVEQLAGDLLPDPTLEQRIASGYNRLLQTTEEGGAQAKEYMAIHAADRVRNVSEVWLGSTLGCAQCHDHKYDPFTMKDFYSMAAFFADIKEKPIGKRQPNLKLPTPEEEKEMAALRADLAEKTIPKLLAADKALAEQLKTAQSKWETETLASLQTGKDDWQVVKPEKLKSAGGQELKVQPDGSVLAGGKKNPDRDNYSAVLKSKGTVTGIRLEALIHDSMPKKGLGRGNGNFVMTGFAVKQGGKPVKIAAAQADYEQPGWPVTNTLDGKKDTGWAGNGHIEPNNRTAMFLFETPVDLGDGGELEVELQHQSIHGKHAIGRFRLSVTSSESPTLSGGIDVPLEIQDALKITAAERNPKQQKVIGDHYQSISPVLAPHRRNLADWKKRLEDIDKNVQTMLVSEALPEPRMTRILPRGNWLDDSGEIVEPAVPVFLAHDPVEDRRATRLDLAKWVVDERNPLTSRAFVNRMWKLFFGAGLSPVLNDLGGQGKPPTHPELLDWLAADFRESGWNVKHLVKLLVMSDTYRQSSVAAPEMAQKDPANTWLTRQNRWRLEAELIRDTALELSGLLVDELGGKSVKPYQPAGYWQHLNFPKREWQADQGEKIYRRGLYTFWCRSFPHPAMLAFDATSREECTADRPRSNTPQQALVLLNDPIFVEAARVFAQEISRQKGNPAARIEMAWSKATSRKPTAEESKILAELFENQKARYAADPEAAKQFVSTGDFTLPDSADLSELAAWTQVTRAILNAYETTSRN